MIFFVGWKKAVGGWAMKKISVYLIADELIARDPTLEEQ